MEIIEKSLSAIGTGNEEAHNVRLKIYENKINNIAKKHKLVVQNSNKNKLFFLLQLGISSKLFSDGYYFLEKYFDDDMKSNLKKIILVISLYKYNY